MMKNSRKRADMSAEQFEQFRTEMRRLQKVNGVTNKALAELVGCSAEHICTIARGRKYPSNELAKTIADVFSTTVARMCGTKEKREVEREVDIEIMRKFGLAYREKRIARMFSRAEVAGFAGITKECYADFEDGQCSLGDSVLEKLNRLYAVEKEVETVEVIKEVEAECPISLDLIDTVLDHLAEINMETEEKRDMFRRLSEARTNIIEKQIFG